MQLKNGLPDHQTVINDFLLFLNKKSNDYILKGGTSLSKCYGMRRKSDDIDFDSVDKFTIKKIVNDFCDINNYSYRIAKDTDTVKRFMIDYGDSGHPLKIEISYRRKDIDKNNCVKINGTLVYNINTITGMKINAYLSRDKIRDLYDVIFICDNFWDDLSNKEKEQITEAFEYKGLEQFDYLVENAENLPDDIDIDKLAEDFLTVYDKIGLEIPDIDDI